MCAQQFLGNLRKSRCTRKHPGVAGGTMAPDRQACPSIIKTPRPHLKQNQFVCKTNWVFYNVALIAYARHLGNKPRIWAKQLGLVVFDMGAYEAEPGSNREARSTQGAGNGRPPTNQTEADLAKNRSRPPARPTRPPAARPCQDPGSRV